MVRILKRYDVGRLALKGPDYPYVIPMNHTYFEGKLLLH
ncbi:MAG: pyridoxamine 5'-phosphate oxidase family protein, partial [Methanocella sp.]